MPTALGSDVLDAIGALGGTFGDVVRRRGDPLWHDTLLASIGVVPRAITSTLPWLVRARAGHDESLVRVLDANAERDPDALAVEMDDEQLTWAELAAQTSKVARYLAGQGVRRGDVVVLMGENSPAYLALLFGISRVGATASLINHHLEGRPLAHAIRTSRARIG